MQHRSFGAGGPQVPAVGQGSWNLERLERRRACAAVRHGIELGLTHVDTAAFYAGGRVESLVGEAIAGLRDRVFLVSKLVPDHATYAGTIAACEQSLRRLRTDYLDCYLLHWLGPHPLEDTVAAFSTLRRKGRIRSWGVSNVDETTLAKLLTIAGDERPACNQVLYNLAERSVEHAVIPYCQGEQISIVAYSPLGSGALLTPGSASESAAAEVAARHAATPYQVALAYLLRHPHLLTIPKAASHRHLEANAAAADLILSPEDVSQLDAAFPLGPWRGGVPLPSN